MTSKSVFVVGFDPGGIDQFGWCLAEATDRIRVKFCGTSDNAKAAVDAVCNHIDNATQLAGAGIDSPLWWVANGHRRVDQIVRAEMQTMGAKNVGGTVQSVNSLRGACLAQGILAAFLLRSRFPNIRITESHPKALLWLIGSANKQRRTRDVKITDLAKLIECNFDEPSEHVRDAALGAVAAFAMLRKAPGWRDLALDEKDAFVPVAPVEYWMPIKEAR